MNMSYRWPKPSETGMIPTHGGGYMFTDLPEASEAFIEFARTSSKTIIDIGCAYGVATLPALKKSC